MPSVKLHQISKTAASLIFGIMLVAVFGLFLSQASAQVSLGIEYGSNLNLGTRDIRETAMSIINVFLGFLGVIAVALLIYGGYLYMTSQGQADKIEKAKKILLNTVIGLVVILLSYAIAVFLVNQLAKIITSGGPVGPGGGGYFPGGALGGSVYKEVYPEPGAVNVPRNTLIMAMFNEEINVGTVINLSSAPSQCPPGTAGSTCGFLAGDADDPNVKIKRVDEVNPLPSDQVIAMTDPTHKNFVFDPLESLGSPIEVTNYQTTLSENIERANGIGTPGFTWSFQVSNVFDTAPPHIVSVIPQYDQTVNMNAVIQINFNEPVNIVGATLPGNIELTNDTNVVLGQGPEITNNLIISNLFKTVEVISTVPCPMPSGQPTNSCGVVPYCLPANANLTALVKAALVNPTTHETIDPLSGITDAAGNSLDSGIGNLNVSQCQAENCSLNGQADGRPINDPDQFATTVVNDNYWWTFFTNNLLDLDEPQIIEVILPPENQESLDPDDEVMFVPKNQYIKAIFSEYMMSSTLNTENFKVFNEVLCLANYGADCNQMSDNTDWPLEVCDYITAGEGECLYPRGGLAIMKDNYPVLQTTSGELHNVTKVYLKTYPPYLDGLNWYNPRLTSEMKDLYQNCFYNPQTGEPEGPASNPPNH